MRAAGAMVKLATAKAASAKAKASPKAAAKAKALKKAFEPLLAVCPTSL